MAAIAAQTEDGATEIPSPRGAAAIDDESLELAPGESRDAPAPPGIRLSDEDRSYERLDREDLNRLVLIARDDREARFARRPRWRPYADRVLCSALCQGAALHYIDGRNGVKDFDVYTFYAEHPTGPFPYRWRTEVDFGPSRASVGIRVIRTVSAGGVST